MEKLAQYNKMWAVLATALVLLFLRYVNLNLNDVVEAATIMFAVWAAPSNKGQSDGYAVEKESPVQGG